MRLPFIPFPLARNTIAFGGCCLLLLVNSTLAADPVADMANFSVFGKIDINELATSDVKTTPGPPMGGRSLSVQSCYIMPGSPAQQMEALRHWNPLRHRELKVFLHGDLPGSPSPPIFRN